MEKKTIYKIGAILIIIGFLIPVIATATEPVLTANIDKYPKETIHLSTNTLTATETSHIQALKGELVEIENDESFGDHNMVGKWGLYDSFEDGELIALKTGTEIFGRVSHDGEKQYFYLFLRPFLKTFNGVVLIDDEFYSISGKYMKDRNKYTAMWEMEDKEGWFVGQST